MTRRISFVFAVLLGIAACDASEPIAVTHAWVRLPAPGLSVAAGYFDIVNRSTTPIALIGATSDAARSIEMHAESHDGDVMQMRQLDSVVLAPEQTVSFSPGGTPSDAARLHRPDVERDRDFTAVLRRLAAKRLVRNPHADRREHTVNWKFWQTGVDTGMVGWIGRIATLVVAGYLIVCLGLSWWWDYEPDAFSVDDNAQAHAVQRGVTVVTGYTTAATVARLAETLLDKRGGYLSNDIFPPGVWLDNVPSWEFGVLVQIRDMSREMRLDFSRSQSQSAEDPDLSEAEGKFYWDNASWVFPDTEGEYRKGIQYLEHYMHRLADPNHPEAEFYPRADNLRNWLAGVSTRLGSLSQRLSTAVGKRQLNTGLAGDSSAPSTSAAPGETEVKTPWLEIDDVFYEARGHTWALLHLLHAIDHDFKDVLEKKNARISLQQIIRELEPTQAPIWSPMVLNGDGLGLLANHSLVMASYISRANAAIIDLRNLLEQG